MLSMKRNVIRFLLFKVLEYGEDLETYHKQGYGHELNYHQACPLVEDLVTRIRYTHHVQ